MKNESEKINEATSNFDNTLAKLSNILAKAKEDYANQKDINENLNKKQTIVKEEVNEMINYLEKEINKKD